MIILLSLQSLRVGYHKNIRSFCYMNVSKTENTTNFAHLPWNPFFVYNFQMNKLQIPVVLVTHVTFACSNSTTETLEKGVKYVQSKQKNNRTMSMTHISHLFLVFLLLNLNNKCQLGSYINGRTFQKNDISVLIFTSFYSFVQNFGTFSEIFCILRFFVLHLTQYVINHFPRFSICYTHLVIKLGPLIFFHCFQICKNQRQIHVSHMHFQLAISETTFPWFFLNNSLIFHTTDTKLFDINS